MESYGWFNALTLSERKKFFKNNTNINKNDKTNDWAEEFLNDWKKQSPFSLGSYFSQRLSLDDIKEYELIDIISESVENYKRYNTSNPVWLMQILDAFKYYRSNNVFEFLIQPKTHRVNEFLYLIGPIINEAASRLKDNIRKIHNNSLPFSIDAITNILIVNIVETMLMRISRTLILELNVARIKDKLSGHTSGERFDDFIRFIQNPDVSLSILYEYPVLARKIITRINNWVNFSTELLTYLARDWESICLMFKNSFTDRLTNIRYTGDTHGNGKAVSILKFESGFQLVFKPRSMAIDIHFQELLLWLNDHGANPKFRTIKLYDRGNYGWMEYVQHSSCSNDNEVENFYRRQGEYLALLHSLEAIDFHFENLIAAGEYPMLVDLESLFHPHVTASKKNRADRLSDVMMEHSVLRVGLLPLRVWFDKDSEGVDMSGLGAEEGQLLPGRFHYLERIGSDDMHFTRKKGKMPPSNHRPKLNNIDVDVIKYTNQIMQGFSDMYYLLMKQRSLLLSSKGPLSTFDNNDIRFVARPTRSYFVLLYESFHPDLLRNALDHDKFIDNLWVGLLDRPTYIKIISFERYDLSNGDIPIFRTRPNSRNIISSSGKIIHNFFENSSMSLAKARLKSLNEEDLSKQLWLIKSSMSTLFKETRIEPGYQKIPPRKLYDNHQLRKKLIRNAKQIGDRIIQIGLSKKDLVWLGLVLIKNNYWALVPLSLDLYSGLPGIALFFSYLSLITKERKYTNLSLRLIYQIQEMIDRNKNYIPSIGGFGGWGGIIHTFLHVGTVLNKPTLIREAKKYVDNLPELIIHDSNFDIVEGSAGCIKSLISFYHYTNYSKALDIAKLCGEHLLNNAVKSQEGVGWITLSSLSKEPLSGFAHGSAGIALALLELAEITNDLRYKEKAKETILYERSLFSSSAHNWLDLRMFDEIDKRAKGAKPTFMMGWCHGAPGIGLARLNSYKYNNDSEILKEIYDALETTIKQGFGKNHCLCHGDLGNLEFILEATMILDDNTLIQKKQYLLNMIIESMENKGWLCGLPLYSDSPSFMLGLSGIGYELLRMADPTLIPSVLTLESPTI